MTVYFTTTNKRFNSTKQVTGGTSFNVTLKDKTSITNPVLLVNSNNTSWNYCIIPTFGRSYFITNIIAVNNNLFEYYLSVDVLGTYSTQIKTKTLLVERSESDGEEWLFDSALTHECTNFTYNSKLFDIPQYDTTGTYVLQTVAGGQASTAGGNAVYGVSASTLSSLVNELFTTDFYGNDTITDDNVKTYFNPFQYITSCRWFPINLPKSGTSIKFGWWTSSYSGGLINTDTSLVPIYSAPVQMPDGDDWTWYDGNWARYLMYVPGCGTVEIDPMYANKQLDVKFWVDVLTGNVFCRVMCGNSEVLSLNGQWGIDIQLTQLSTDTSSSATTVIGLLATPNDNILTGTGEQPANYGAAVFEGLATGVLKGGMDVLDIAGAVAGKSVKDAYKAAMQPALALSGANGNATMLRSQPKIMLSWKKYNPIADIKQYVGQPCHRPKQLGSLSGFTQCANAYIEINALAEEKIAIKKYLEGGFFLE